MGCITNGFTVVTGVCQHLAFQSSSCACSFAGVHSGATLEVSEETICNSAVFDSHGLLIHGSLTSSDVLTALCARLFGSFNEKTSLRCNYSPDFPLLIVVLKVEKDVWEH